jgi:hypothetical protein
MLNLTTAVSRVTARLNKTANDTTIKNRIINHINDTCLEKWNAFAWSFRWREYPLVLSSVVTSGTMTATNGTQSITASGTPFVAGTHEGAWIRFTGDTLQAWYRIKTVSSTSVAIIDPAYQGTSGASKVYELCKTDYLLPTELSEAAELKVTVNGCDLIPTYFTGMRNTHPPFGRGEPRNFAVFNQSQVYSSYTTGTVTGSLNGKTLTGVGTLWLANVKEGDEVVISGDTNTYTVFSVDSDTQITLYNKLKAAAAGAAVVISRQFGKVIRVDTVPDNPYVCFVKGLRSYTPLVNDADTNEMLVKYPQAVIEGAIWREAGSSPDPREDSLFQRSELLWARAQGEDEQLFPKTNYTPIFDFRQDK